MYELKNCFPPTWKEIVDVFLVFRKEQEGAAKQLNYMRQYYDIYCLLNHPEVQNFLDTPEYQAHKQKRFPKVDLQVPVFENL